MSSCDNRNKSQNKMSYTIEYMLENLNRSYTADLLKYDTLLTQHFPKSLDTTNIQVLKVFTNEVDIDYLEVTNRIYDKWIFQKYSSNCIGSYAGDDPCVLAFHKFDSWKEYPESKFNPCLKDKYPIPDFRGNKYRDLGTVSRLPKDFMIYILDSQSDNNMPDSLIVGYYDLLDKWEKGFSRGVAISEEKMVIIYWVITWE